MMLKPNEIESIRKKIDEINKFLEDEIEANPERLSQNGLYENVITKFNELLALIKRLIIENRLEKTKKLEEPRKRNIKKHLPELLEIKDSRFTSRIPTDVQSDFEQLQLNVSDNDLLLVYADVFRDKQLYAGPNCQKILLAITSYFSAGGYLTDKEEKLISFLDEIKPSEENKEDVATALNSRMETAKKDFFLPFEFIPDEALPKTTTAQTINIEDFSAYVKTIIFAENVLGIDDLISESRISAVMVEKDEEILSAWEEVIEAYQLLSPINLKDNPETIKEKEHQYALFLSAVFEFRKVTTQCLPYKNTEELNTLFRSLSNYFNKHHPSLKLTLGEKDSIIEKLIRLSAVTLSESQTQNYTIVLESIASNILHTMGDKNLPLEEANNSEVLKNTVKDAITSLYSCLKDTFIVVAFTNAATSTFNQDEARQDPAYYSPLKEFFSVNETVKSQLKKIGPAIRSELEYSKANKKHKRVLKPPPRNLRNAMAELITLGFKLDNLDNNEENDPPISNNQEKQAAFKYQVSKTKYTLSLQEIGLLEKVTDLKFGDKIVPVKNPIKTYSEGTHSYNKLIQLIVAEKGRRIEANKSWLRRLLPFLKEPIAVLDHAKLYIQYHGNFYKQTTQPLGRLARRDNDAKKAAIRDQFKSVADKVFTFTTRSKALKTLNKLMKEKTAIAKNLKSKAKLAYPENNADKSIEVSRNATTQQHLTNNARVLFQYDTLSRNKNSFFSKLDESSPQADILYENYLEIKKNLSELEAGIQLTKNSCKEAKKVSIVVSYKDEELIENRCDDVDRLLANIKKLINQITNTRLTKGSSLEEFKDHLNTIGLTHTIAKKAKKLLAAKLMLLPLEEFKGVLKRELARSLDSLIERFTLPNSFKPDAKDAVAKLGEMLKKSTSAYRTLKVTAYNYINALQLQILAKQEAVTILQELQSSKLSPEQLVKELRKKANSEQESLISKLVDPEIALTTSHGTMSHRATVNSKLLELFNDLNTFADIIQKGSIKNDFDIDECLTALVKSCNFKIKSLEKNRYNETGNVMRLLNDARQHVQAHTYYSNHSKTNEHPLGKLPLCDIVKSSKLN